MRNLCLVLLVMVLGACGTLKAPYYSSEFQGWQSQNKTSDKKIVHTLFLVGDAGKLDSGEHNIVLNAVKNDLEATQGVSTLVYLGDNIYPFGMPKANAESRVAKEKVINAQLNLAKYVNGNTYFIPGNHDWLKGRKGGLKALKRQEEYIESFYDKGFKNEVKFYPGNGCGDPKVKKVNKDLVFVFLDSQWWLENWDKVKKINKGCDIKSRGDLLAKIEEIFIEYKNDQIVVLMHHPIFTNGVHGGKFSFYDHVFPLRHIKNLWIPLPVVGSLYPIIRQTTGSVQDASNSSYIELSQGINQIAEDLDVDVIFASGHEHNLQYFDKDNVKYIVSGSGSKKTFAMAGGDVGYSREARGYAKLLFYEDMETWVEYYTVSDKNEIPQLEFRTQISKPKAGTVDIAKKYPPVTMCDTMVAANKDFVAGKGKGFFLGKQYRNIWGTDVEVPVIDLENKLGGLTPIKKGGGMSSNSLRMEANDGRQYILRSINKDYTKLVDRKYSTLKVLDIMKDQNSASHPYGALMLPALSKAAGIYYTSPQLVFLKHQKQLGNYNELFPEELYLLEQRPSGDWSDAEQFGKSDDIISYNDLLEKLREKKKHYVDQKWVLKSRMFDLLVHDWDRHDDQWRWATFEYGDSVVYRPIPRDRDQVFYKFEGVIPWYVSTFVIKKFKTMKGNVRDVKNLSFNARYFDRYFLNELDWKDWEIVIRELQDSMTDEILEKSLSALPQEVTGLNAEIPEILKSRRDNLMAIGKKLYDFISKEVEVTGTDNDEDFLVERKNDGSVTISYSIEREDKGDLKKYERTFYPNTTKEVRLYGLRGKDEFKIIGSDVNKIRIRIIGGEDNDKIVNETKGGGLFAYDLKDGIKIKGKGVCDKTKDEDIWVNDYDRKGFKYNKYFPFVRLGYTKDDGMWFGASYSMTTNKWRKYPYSSKQRMYFEVAPGNQDAFKFGYDGHFPDMIGGIDFKPRINVDFPSIENFFGYGNESVNPGREKEYNWVTLTGAKVNPLFSLESKNQHFIFDFGPAYQTMEIQDKAGRVSLDPILGFSAKELQRKHFVGAESHFTMKSIDREDNPSNGFLLYAGLTYQYNLTDEDDLLSLSANSKFYLTLCNYPKVILANNIGFKTIEGKAQFYQTPDIGNLTNLRGYRKNRFRGESVFYENVDLRFHVWDWSNTYVPVNIGCTWGFDVGRAWEENEKSKRWHNSKTIGIWFDVLDAFVMQPYYSFTEEDDFFSFIMRFSF
ncbi:metallophosphoesterase [Plebeiibacterium marinum]|uniref:Metallophosphoesterase n=1 Tax=Plebeiibacterium marinum TaxID=2992111 RepID=A0AAE3SKQ1_9BACT|nr:metallophosphoesterase [Plebeiobacterium marinum]MCW3806753.1 metallophosphoesterase [Plebeiobacterium marinum]